MKDEINDKIVGTMFKIFRTFKDVMSFDSKNSQLTMIQLEALIHLKKNKELQMRNFAEHFSITMPTATALIDKLIKSNFAIRKNDPKDRRIVKVNITKLGEKVLYQAVKQRNNKFNKLLSHLSKEDKKELHGILEKIIEV